MHLYDFISEDELNDLPEDNQQAFSSFVRFARRNLSETSRGLNDGDENDWRQLQEMRHGFTNVVLAAAKRYGIDPFLSANVPKVNKFDSDIYFQLIADLDHYITQLAIDTSIRRRSESTRLPDASKDKIRSYIHHLKEAIQNSPSFNEAKKERLLDKVAEFEAALDKSRLSYVAVARLTLEILAVPVTLWSAYDVAHKLLSNINQVVAEAKVEEDEQRKLPALPKPFVMIAPRAPEIEERKKRTDFGSGGRDRNLDDEIPF
ncbi:hypothetical protein FJ937_11870 [Mesorhizobium sp. B2-4-4]|uniref:hypothetical protein n=1 Tax=Mesorhizobium sp. B2-4-4 TaxID=2589945 RepID=UPI00112CD3B8|nr:hypothetical protein [Mesorhizobium sp. B2-4-4]TPL52053.1 hypothetical protein FJ937_11870 [Mesorhizobium sp. B2-4-4]